MRNYLIGVSGGIACYKIPILCRHLIKAGHNVKVILTNNATKFIAPLTFESLTSNRVYLDDFNVDIEPDSIDHIALGEWADSFIIAPASANTIAKMANGICDNLLTSTVMAYGKKELFVCPAMNTQMLENEITLENISKLEKRGMVIIHPEEGELACRVNGTGKMPEPEIIFERILEIQKASQPYQGIKFLVTAGPTREDIDPVRYITNRSSGKMGLSIVDEIKKGGGSSVTVVGDVDKSLLSDTQIQAMSADDMLTAVQSNVADVDILIMSAAVADYKVVDYSDIKIKKNDNSLTLKLIKNPDILKEVSGDKKSNQVFVGFAAETNDLEKNAKDKLARKNLDMIVANDVSRSDIAFDSDYNEVTVYFSDGRKLYYEKMLKSDVSQKIVELAVAEYKRKNA